MNTQSMYSEDAVLQQLTFPADWENPQSGNYDLVCIGAGPAGLIAAMIGAGLGGLTCVGRLVEAGFKDVMQGDGCTARNLTSLARHIMVRPSMDVVVDFFLQAVKKRREARQSLPPLPIIHGDSSLCLRLALSTIM